MGEADAPDLDALLWERDRLHDSLTAERAEVSNLRAAIRRVCAAYPTDDAAPTCVAILRAVLGANIESALVAPAPVRWYCVSREGIATWCKDEADARDTATSADVAWPNCKPHRAMQLVDAAEIERLRAALAQAMAERARALAVGDELDQRHERTRQALSERLAGTVMSKYASRAECEAARAALRNAMLDVRGA